MQYNIIIVLLIIILILQIVQMYYKNNININMVDTRTVNPIANQISNSITQTSNLQKQNEIIDPIHILKNTPTASGFGPKNQNGK